MTGEMLRSLSWEAATERLYRAAAPPPGPSPARPRLDAALSRLHRSLPSSSTRRAQVRRFEVRKRGAEGGGGGVVTGVCGLPALVRGKRGWGPLVEAGQGRCEEEEEHEGGQEQREQPPPSLPRPAAVESKPAVAEPSPETVPNNGGGAAKLGGRGLIVRERGGQAVAASVSVLSLLAKAALHPPEVPLLLPYSFTVGVGGERMGRRERRERRGEEESRARRECVCGDGACDLVRAQAQAEEQGAAPLPHLLTPIISPVRGLPSLPLPSLPSLWQFLPQQAALGGLAGGVTEAMKASRRTAPVATQVPPGTTRPSSLRADYALSGTGGGGGCYDTGLGVLTGCMAVEFSLLFQACFSVFCPHAGYGAPKLALRRQSARW
eukprot:2941392-Rhodomonas_salina.1